MVNEIKQITLSEAETILIQAKYYEKEAYKDLLSYCFSENLSNTEGYLKEKENYFKAFAEFEMAISNIFNIYLNGKRPEYWQVDFLTNTLNYRFDSDEE